MKKITDRADIIKWSVCYFMKILVRQKMKLAIRFRILVKAVYEVGWGNGFYISRYSANIMRARDWGIITKSSSKGEKRFDCLSARKQN